MRIIVIDDDASICRSLQIHLQREGHEVQTARTGAEGLRILEKVGPAVAFVDLNLPDISGLEVLRRLRDKGGERLVIMITGEQDAMATIEAIRLGAFDYIRKPLDLDAMLVGLEKAEQQMKRKTEKALVAVHSTDARTEIIGADPKIIDVLKQIGLLSGSRVPVLIQGESGTGKELVARALHDASSPDAPFVAVNCSAVVATLMESELFGHEKGAFTGAESTKVGKLEFAAHGTVFLDEVGDMSPELQAKLLRAVHEREFERVGGMRSIYFHGRVVAATHRNLESMVAEEKFREDLYYRLTVSTVHLPPLRERRGDIPLLVKHLVARMSQELHREVGRVEENALRRLQAYDWPGNVRELANVITRALLLERTNTLTEETVIAAMGTGTGQRAKPGEILPLREVERQHVERALASTGWNIKRTAELLDVSRVTLRKKIKDYEIVLPPDLRKGLDGGPS